MYWCFYYCTTCFGLAGSPVRRWCLGARGVDDSPLCFSFPLVQNPCDKSRVDTYQACISNFIFNPDRQEVSYYSYMAICKHVKRCHLLKKKRCPYELPLSSHGVISPTMRRTDETFGGSSQLFTGFCVDACRICMLVVVVFDGSISWRTRISSSAFLRGCRFSLSA